MKYTNWISLAVLLAIQSFKERSRTLDFTMPSQSNSYRFIRHRSQRQLRRDRRRGRQ